MKEVIYQFLNNNFVELIWIAILFFFGKGVLRVIVKRMQKLVDDGDDTTVSKKEQRAKTLGSIILTAGNTLIYIVLLLMFLKLFGIDVTPILAGAGVVGLAVGFGAQSLVKDLVSGLFILAENQYGIGDNVVIGKAEGVVAKISIRSTVLQDENGGYHYLSNGSINNVINKSQGN